MSFLFALITHLSFLRVIVIRRTQVAAKTMDIRIVSELVTVTNPIFLIVCSTLFVPLSGNHIYRLDTFLHSRVDYRLPVWFTRSNGFMYAYRAGFVFNSTHDTGYEIIHGCNTTSCCQARCTQIHRRCEVCGKCHLSTVTGYKSGSVFGWCLSSRFETRPRELVRKERSINLTAWSHYSRAEGREWIGQRRVVVHTGWIFVFGGQLMDSVLIFVTV